MTGVDEPVLGDDFNKKKGKKEDSIEQNIRKILNDVPYGVLSTQIKGQPYSSLVSVVFTPDLKYGVFATPQTTRKYKVLSQEDRISMLLDNRALFPNDLMKIEAVTITGKASEIKRGKDYDQLSDLLLKKHSYLKELINAHTCALFRIEPVRFFYTRRFHEVYQWILPNSQP